MLNSGTWGLRKRRGHCTFSGAYWSMTLGVSIKPSSSSSSAHCERRPGSLQRARVQRGESSTARCASTEDHQAPSRPQFCKHKRQSGCFSVSNCTRSSGTALCDSCSIGQAFASGLVCLLSVIRPPRPNQSWDCRAMGCPIPQSPGGFSRRSLEGRRTCQPLNR